MLAATRRPVHAQNSTLNLLDEWYYGWRARRQGHTNGFFIWGSIDPAWDIALWFNSRFKSPSTQFTFCICLLLQISIRFSEIAFCLIHSGTRLSGQPLFPGTANPLVNSLTPFRRRISSLAAPTSPHGTPICQRQKDICF